MLTLLLPVISLSVSLARPVGAVEEVVATPRAAQVRLAEVLAEADAVHGVRSIKRHTIAFALDRGGRSLRAIAATRANGDVVSLTITEVGPAREDIGNLSWLASELAQTTAVTRLAVDADGAVTITTSDDRSYMAIPGRGSGGNLAVEARWAGAWDADEL